MLLCQKIEQDMQEILGLEKVLTQRFKIRKWYNSTLKYLNMVMR